MGRDSAAADRCHPRPLHGLPTDRHLSVRVGTHFNTGFALRLSADYAEIASDTALLKLLIETADRWYGADENCPAWGEPSGDEFLSSTLIEAECMRRLMPTDRFQPCSIASCH